MNIRLISAFATKAMSLAICNGAEARAVAHVTYVAPAVVYAPPPRPVHCHVPAPAGHVAAHAAMVIPASNQSEHATGFSS